MKNLGRLISIRLAEDEYASLKQLAEIEDRSISAFARRLLIERLMPERASGKKGGKVKS